MNNILLHLFLNIYKKKESTHFIKQLNEEQLVRKVSIIPLEMVVETTLQEVWLKD